MPDITRDNLRVWEHFLAEDGYWSFHAKEVTPDEFDAIARHEGYVKVTGLKEERTTVHRRTWGPGDTYLVARHDQVMEESGFREGMKVKRYVSPWRACADEDPI